MTLTKEKLEEYRGQIKRGELDVDELKAGLIAVYGSIPIEGSMTLEEFLDYIGVPLEEVDMSDELRREFEAERRNRLIKRLLARDIDHPAPEICPDCYSELVSSFIYVFEGEIHESKYCKPCDDHVPEPKGNWSKWKPKPSDFFTEDQEDDLKRSKQQQLSGQRW